jgi:hypothetical protein
LRPGRRVGIVAVRVLIAIPGVVKMPK